ncbi:MAG: peptide ABC transporter substrate-binding protein [Simkaniaceae bacterium]|nr:peptide ABC transporter substrate-binding protein [Simkaniaceae bacterium]
MNKLSHLVKGVILTALIALTGCSSSRESCDSCTPNAAQEQVMRINIGVEPQTTDPRKARCLMDVNIIKMFMEGLTRIDQEYNATPAIAKEINVSSDGLVYTIKLKKTFWSNGDELTAHDFLYAWKKTLSPLFPSDNAHLLYVIKNAEKVKTGKLPIALLGVEAPADDLLVIQLERPTPYFTKLLALPTYFPVNAAVDKHSPNWMQNASTFVGNGPFAMAKWMHSDKMVAVKNKFYWDKEAVKLKRIEMSMVTDETGLKLFENQELDWEGSPFTVIPGDALENLTERGILQKAPGSKTFWIRVNTTVEPLQNMKLRQALARAINREEICQNLYLEQAIPATGIVPSSMGLTETPFFNDGDVENARILFEEAMNELGIEASNLDSLTLTYKATEGCHRLAQVLQQQWYEAFGFMIGLEAIEHKVFFDNVSKKNYQLAFGDWFADFDDPVNFLEVFKNKTMGTNNTGWESLNYAKAIADSFHVNTNEERIAHLKEAEHIIAEECPVIPITHGAWTYVKNRHVHNISISREGHIDFKHAYIGVE